MVGNDTPVRALHGDDQNNEIDTFSILLPCQRFRIRACVMSTKDVPLTLEFGLRYLKTVGWATPEDIQSFFGFGPNETSLMLVDLARPGLIESLPDGGISLSDAGRELFAHADPDQPQMIEIEEIDEPVGFDLVSFALAKKLQRLPHHRAMDELPLPDRKRASHGRDAAKEAFQRSFREFRETRWRGADRGIYSIVDVDPAERFTSELAVPIVVRTGSGCVVEPDFSELRSLGRPDSRAMTIASIVRYLNQLAWPGDADAAIRFLASCDAGALSGFSVDGVLNPSDWMRFVLAGRPPREELSPIRHVFGSVVAPVVKETLEGWLPGLEVPERDPTLPVVWLRPRLATWGRSAAFHEVAMALGSDTAGIALLAPSDDVMEDKRVLLRSYGPRKDQPTPFSSAFLVNGKALPGSLELLIDPGRWVLALVHCQADGDLKIPLPIGFVTANCAIVGNIQASLAAALPDEGTWNVLWADKGLSDKGAVAVIQHALGRRGPA